MNDENKKKLQEIVNTFSYYNAAESPQYGNEASERNKAKKRAFDEIKSWGLSQEEFEKLYYSLDSRGLTRVTEFTYGVYNGN